jgi:hypothetical protein
MNFAETTITRAVYEGLQRGQFDIWDEVIATEVELFSHAQSYEQWGSKGLDGLKYWAGEFLSALCPRIDLIEEFNGDEKAYLIVTLHWKHVAPFFGITPTGREGSSSELFLLTIKDRKVVKFQVADLTMDLAFYLRDRGVPFIHNVRPVPLIKGEDRVKS